MCAGSTNSSESPPEHLSRNSLYLIGSVKCTEDAFLSRLSEPPVGTWQRKALSEFYSSDVYVQRLMQQLLPIFAVVGFCDSMQTALSGALRGIGRHSVAAATYLLAYYGVACAHVGGSAAALGGSALAASYAFQARECCQHRRPGTGGQW